MNVSYKLVLAGVAAVLAAGCSNSGAPNVPQVAGSGAQIRGSSSNVGSLQSWHAAIAHAPTPGKGCYTAVYPQTTWTSVPCVAAPNRPYIPRSGAGHAQTVGNGNDYAAVTSTLTSNAVGSFPVVRRLKSETDGGRANVYSLQLNSNFISGDQACANAYNPAQCLGWLQYVYSSSSHAAFMQYWLIRYTGGSVHCPPGWNSFSPDCYKNSSAVSVPQEAVTDLPRINLSGNAVNGGLDTLEFTDGSNAYSTNGPDTVMYLSEGWTGSEFNIIGDGGGSQADFNAGTALTVKIALTDGTSNAPTCQPHDGTTGETNNLNLGTCTAAGGATPQVTFKESLKK
ncbi:MAG: hypothetical protein JOZ77_12335 [Candidatus Eremiobacteraeota bacterium]|nr:hypothetical protein [Candidatus Eremiobacteraeota bacterium]